MSKFKTKLYKITDDIHDKGVLKSYAEDIEQLAADEYGHETVGGWCCACPSDIAFAESYLREAKPEIFKEPTHE